MSTRVLATLGSGDLKGIVQLPKDEDVNEWLAANTVDFFNELSLLYGMCVDDAKRFTELGEGFPPGFEYRWAETSTGKGAVRCTSPEYVDYVMTWIESQIDDETIFPTDEDVPFPPNFIDYIKDIFKRMFRVFAIIYHHHIDVFSADADEDGGTSPLKILNTSFKHFVFFCLEFDLLDDTETPALAKVYGRLKEQYESKD